MPEIVLWSKWFLHLFSVSYPQIVGCMRCCFCTRACSWPTFPNSAADGRGRERRQEPTSTLEVPEQQRTPVHHIRSRSVSPHREQQGRIRSRPPNIPAQRWRDQIDHQSAWMHVLMLASLLVCSKRTSIGPFKSLFRNILTLVWMLPLTRLSEGMEGIWSTKCWRTQMIHVSFFIGTLNHVRY